MFNSKKAQNVINGTEYIAEDRNGYAIIAKQESNIDSNGNVYGGEIVARYGQDGFPPHSSEVVDEKDVESKMKSIADLRKWSER